MSRYYRHRLRPLCTAIVVWSALAPALAATSLATRALVEPSDLTYGVYLNGTKVGWMRATTTVGKTTAISLELHASVGGMGQVSTIDIVDQRVYAGPEQRLDSLLFSQKAATGTVVMKGERNGDSIVLTVSAGNATQQQRYRTDETLKDATVAIRLAREGKVGATAISHHFDPSLQRAITVRQQVMAAETRTLAGIPSKTFRIDATYTDLGVTETTWYDQAGKILETKVGGFFVARLEPPDVAKKLDYQQDLLAAAVVKTPRRIRNASALEHLTVAFFGFADMEPPSSTRQRVVRRADTVVFDLTRDPAPPRRTIAELTIPKDVEAELASTPFIQSDAPAIRTAAKKAVGPATTVPEIIERLTHYVFTQVRDEYVPAYSNALEALETGRGDCTEHSVLFVALARALGLPARVAVGIAYWPAGDGFGWHAWAEVYVDGRWYVVDPTWDQPIADATHVKLAGGGPAEQARIVMLLGRLRVASMSD